MARASFAALSLGAALATEETAASLRGSAAARRLGSALPAAGDVNTTAGARRLGTAYCIDAGSNGNPSTGDQIIIWECNGEAAQEWIWVGDSSGNYYIKYGTDTTKCMTVTCDTGKSDCSGTPVTFEDCTDSSYQLFGGANGHIYFQGSSCVVDAGAWPLSNGLGLSVYDENGNPQQNWEYGDDYQHFYNSDSLAALAAEETPTALPASEDVNATAGVAPTSSLLQGLLSETIYCNPNTDPQQMCPPGNVACPQCGSDRCECPSSPGPSPSPDTKCSWTENMNSDGNNIGQAPWSEDPQTCCNHCGEQSGCVAWTFIPYSHECWLKSWVPSRDQWRWDDSAISGQIGAPSLEAAAEEDCDGMYHTKNYAEGTEHECRCDNYCDNFCDDDPNGCARTCRILNGVFEHTPSVHAGDRTCAWHAYSVSNPVNYDGYDCSWMVGTGEGGNGDNCQDFWSDGAWKCREGNQNQNNCHF